jgi:hypothetical protein
MQQEQQFFYGNVTQNLAGSALQLFKAVWVIRKCGFEIKKIISSLNNYLKYLPIYIYIYIYMHIAHK